MLSFLFWFTRSIPQLIHALENIRFDPMEFPSPVMAIRKHTVTVWKSLFERNSAKMSFAEQITMYLGILVGVYFSSTLRSSNTSLSPTLAALTALVIMPAVYEKLSIDPNAPFLIRFALFVQQGVFWDVLFEAIGT